MSFLRFGFTAAAPVSLAGHIAGIKTMVEDVHGRLKENLDSEMGILGGPKDFKGSLEEIFKAQQNWRQIQKDANDADKYLYFDVTAEKYSATMKLLTVLSDQKSSEEQIITQLHTVLMANNQALNKALMTDRNKSSGASVSSKRIPGKIVDAQKAVTKLQEAKAATLKANEEKALKALSEITVELLSIAGEAKNQYNIRIANTDKAIQESKDFSNDDKETLKDGSEEEKNILRDMQIDKDSKMTMREELNQLKTLRQAIETLITIDEKAKPPVRDFLQLMITRLSQPLPSKTAKKDMNIEDRALEDTTPIVDILNNNTFWRDNIGTNIQRKLNSIAADLHLTLPAQAGPGRPAPSKTA